MWNGAREYVVYALARLAPVLQRELAAVRDDEVLEAIGARARQLLVVLLDAPAQVRVEVGDEYGRHDVEVLREHVHDGVERVVARGGHPLGLLWRRDKETKRQRVRTLEKPIESTLKGLDPIRSFLNKRTLSGLVFVKHA